MTPTRIQHRFAELAAQARRGVVPYFTSCFPSRGLCEALILRADALGAPAVEIGVPFSDSIADGPVIQESFHAVLRRGHRLGDTFELAARVRPSIECGLIAMVSHSIVHRGGTREFLVRAARAGFDGVVIPDLPVEESIDAAEAARQAGLCFIGLVAPTTPAARRERIARASSGFVYQIAVAGTTGVRAVVGGTLEQWVDHVRSVCNLPVCVGFGISEPDQVRAICRFADGVVVGSAFVGRLADADRRSALPEEQVEDVSAFLVELMEAANDFHGSTGRRG